MLEGQHTFAVDTLLGRRDDSALTVCARHMAEKLLDAGCTRQARLSFDPKSYLWDWMCQRFQ